MVKQPETDGGVPASLDENAAREPANQTQAAEPGEAKGRPRLIASDELKGVAENQRPRGMLGRIRADSRPKPLPLPPPVNRGISAFTRTDVVERWNADAAGIRSAEQADNVVQMFGVVGEDFWTGEGITAKRVAARLREIGDKPVEAHINSFGGDMFEGIAVYNVLREHSQPVTVKVMGIAASAASIITMAADEILISAASFIMIHNCSVFGGGNRHDFLELSEFLEPFDRAMAEVYAERTGQDVKAITKMMDEETYLSGSVAIEKGFADKLLTADKTKVDKTAKAADRQVNEVRALELQLVASGVSRGDARDRIMRIKGTPGAAPDNATPGAGTPEPREDWSGAADLLALFRSK